MSPKAAGSSDFDVVLPEVDEVLDQDEEWCEVRLGGQRRRIRFHDYDELYEIPGLYERLFTDKLKCQSPQLIRKLLARALAERDTEPGELRVLDVGAGNGMVGEELCGLGVGAIYGVDIIPEAAAAAHRDRPNVYDDYLVADLTELAPDEHETLAAADLNAMVTVAALGFGDMPPRAFAVAFNLISTPGWLTFNIKEDFVHARDPSGFAGLIRRMFDENVILSLAEERYRHRLSVRGEPLHYVAYVARKDRDIPEAWLD